MLIKKAKKSVMKLVTHIEQSKLIYLKHCDESISISENAHYRILHFGNVLQSIMLKRVPYRLTLPHQYFMLLPLLFIKPKDIIELGLGGGNLLRFINKSYLSARLTSIEYNPIVIECFHRYFNPNNCQTNILSISVNDYLLSNNITAPNWLIYDIYRQGEHDCLNHIKRLLKLLSVDAWITINLPNFTEQELNHTLSELIRIKGVRRIRYFVIPHYQNIIVHIFPQDLTERAMDSVLKQHQYLRWQSIWQHGITC